MHIYMILCVRRRAYNHLAFRELSHILSFDIESSHWMKKIISDEIQLHTALV